MDISIRVSDLLPYYNPHVVTYVIDLFDDHVAIHSVADPTVIVNAVSDMVVKVYDTDHHTAKGMTQAVSAVHDLVLRQQGLVREW